MKSEIRFHILTAVAALASSLLAGYALLGDRNQFAGEPGEF